MGKVTLAVLVLAIALGFYWFGWHDQGANDPITVEGTLTAAGVPGRPAALGPMKGTFTLHITPTKLRFSTSGEGERTSSLVRLDTKKMYALHDRLRIYAEAPFDFVHLSQTETLKRTKETWFPWLRTTAEWDHIGAGEAKSFCNKQILTRLPRILTQPEVPKEIPFLLPMQTLFKEASGEVWVTADTRLGRRYFRMLNRILRICPVGRAAEKRRKRPQLRYVNLAFFPVPMKVVFSAGDMRLEAKASRLSRKRIPSEIFEIPSDYKKVSLKEFSRRAKNRGP